MLKLLYVRLAISKNQLIQQMGSSDNKVALEAVEMLRDRMCLHDGTMQRANLSWANLGGGRSRAIWLLSGRDRPVWCKSPQSEPP
jgi:hypothetical protein